ncbi:helix-turn-helix domain-containing protein [Clostridium paraputrificum]|uniref:helix-turn-helix domain-containing protein n=1 Tax=Clostridium paraputrificum TaxID=29363 RepID=UPI00374E375E
MQEEVREKLINYLNKYGSSLAFVSKEIDISRETLSRFKNNKQDLHINTLNKIDNFIKEKAR